MLPDPDASLVLILQALFSCLSSGVYKGQEERLTP